MASAQTALDLLVLTVLGRRGPLHGYGIANFIEQLSDEALRIDEGSLYPRPPPDGGSRLDFRRMDRHRE